MQGPCVTPERARILHDFLLAKRKGVFCFFVFLRRYVYVSVRAHVKFNFLLAKVFAFSRRVRKFIYTIFHLAMDMFAYFLCAYVCFAKQGVEWVITFS